MRFTATFQSATCCPLSQLCWLNNPSTAITPPFLDRPRHSSIRACVPITFIASVSQDEGGMLIRLLRLVVELT